MSELGDTYNFRFFSPYSQDGNGDKAQGLAYKKDFTLSDWHYFWLGNQPEIMTQNDTGDSGNFNRGGCCCVLNKAGRQMFVMVTHGALNAEARAQYASQYRQMEELYNSGGYPSFFIGDMNARPDDPASAVYESYWTDAYDGAGSACRQGPYATYNAFDLERNMYSNPSRIDYVYYKGSVTPLLYVCNGALYDGYYASDHLPVYADIRFN